MSVNNLLKAFSFLLIVSFLLVSCSNKKQKWFRGNTHAHTVICGHADSTPEFVTNWYHENGYNFLILSEHNHFINPDTVNMPANLRDDFILIPGEEVTGRKIIHTTAMNISKLVDWDFDHEHKSEIIQYHVDGTVDAGGHAILNHPNYKYAVGALDIINVTNLYMFELYNGHPLVNNDGDENHLSTEEIWDSLLTAGMKIYGVASDDAHQFQVYDSTQSNPGRGWVMVESEELVPNAISEAMFSGNFYASSGVFLSEYSISDETISISIDRKKTISEVSKNNVRGKLVDKSDDGFTIHLIGNGGKILKEVISTSVKFPINSTQKYYRAKITYRRINELRGMEEFYAWTQPIFLN